MTERKAKTPNVGIRSLPPLMQKPIKDGAPHPLLEHAGLFFIVRFWSVILCNASIDIGLLSAGAYRENL
jgi:hypothetical protein